MHQRWHRVARTSGTRSPRAWRRPGTGTAHCAGGGSRRAATVAPPARVRWRGRPPPPSRRGQSSSSSPPSRPRPPPAGQSAGAGTVDGGRAAAAGQVAEGSDGGGRGGPPADRRTMYGLLELRDFTEAEFDRTFHRIALAGKKPSDEVQHLIEATEVATLHGSPESRAVDEEDGTTDREKVTVNDLEAYLLQKYRIIDDRWEENLATLTGDAPHVKQRRAKQLKRMEQRAKADADVIFQALLQNAPQLSSSSSSSSSSSQNQLAKELSLTKLQFRKCLEAISTTIDYKTILPLAASMLLVGTSVGITSPIMPFIAEKLHLAPTHYGAVVSSFALSKMLGNVPCAILVERHGRKPYLVHSLCLVGLGVAGMGVSGDWIQLSACRMTVGVGVAALTTASTLTVADVSTPLTRASTFSPLMSAFAAGMALGPAVGGILHDAWGIRDTFFAVGAIYGVAAAWNHASVAETKRDGDWWEKETLPWHDEATITQARSAKNRQEGSASTNLAASISDAAKDTAEQWKALLRDDVVRPICVMNGFYMLSLAGTQFTLLPLLLTGGGAAAATGAAAGLALSASTVGRIYMWMSAVQVLGNPAAGRFADRLGKAPAIVAGGALTSLAMASVPVVCGYAVADASLAADAVNWPLLAGTLGVWSLGGTLLATSHVAAISDAVDDARRSQAIALLRTAGDVGYLCGAVSAGIAADLAGDVGLAMQGGGAILMGSTAWFGLKTLALNRLDLGDKKQ